MGHDSELDTLRRDMTAMRTAIDEMRRAFDSRLAYARFVSRFGARLSQLLSPGAMVLVAAKGDDDLLALGPAHAAHFPQALDGQFAGAYPADDTAAIAHLEALRQEGYDTLVFPEFSAWWLEHYAGLRTYLQTHGAAVAADDVFSVFDLRPGRAGAAPAPLLQILGALRALERQLGRPPTLLDWRSGLNLQAACAEYSVAISREPAVLPHFDRSVDVVAIACDGACAVEEARRVAGAAVIVVDAGAVDIEWLVPGRAADAAPVPMPSAARPSGDMPLTVRGPRGDALFVWIGEGVTPLPGSIEAVMSLFERDPEAGAVGGRVLDFTGRLYHAGGAVLADGSLVTIGEADNRPDDPRYLFVREVDFCSSSFMVTTRRAFDEAGGFDESLRPGPFRDADFGLRVRNRGYSVYMQPEAVAVCSRVATTLLRSSSRTDDRRHRRRFAERWKAALRARPAVFDAWGTSASSRLPLTTF